MFKKIVFAICVLSVNLLNAQTDEQLDKMTVATCDCAEKKDFSSLDASAYQMELGMCIMGAMDVLTEKERATFNFTDVAQMRKMGEKIGIRMGTKCPKVLMAITKAEMERQKNEANEEQKSDTKRLAPPPPPPPPPPAGWGTISGKIKELKETELLTVILIDENQKENKFVWFGHFDGDSDYTSNPQALKGKSVEITFYDQYRYVPQMKEYTKYKQITKLKVK